MMRLNQAGLHSDNVSFFYSLLTKGIYEKHLAGVRGFEPLNMVLHTTTTFIAFSVCGLDYIFTLHFCLGSRSSSLYGLNKAVPRTPFNYCPAVTLCSSQSPLRPSPGPVCEVRSTLNIPSVLTLLVLSNDLLIHYHHRDHYSILVDG